MTYWEKRQQQLNRQMEKDEEKLKKRLSSYFDTEYRKLEKQIAAYYKQYGTDNVIQYRRLMEELPEEDKRLLIEQMDQFAAKYPEYAHLIPVRESIYKLNRLEGLQYSVRMQQLEIGAVENEQITAHLNRQAMRGANAAAETLGFGKNFYSNNPDITKLFVNVSWSNGENFSERIWGNTSKLAYYLNTDIAQGIARGDSYDRLVKRLRKRFGDVSRNDAYRLIYTEGTYVMAEATMQPFIEDFQKYRLSTVGDADVCDICRGVASEVFDIADRQPGVNFPPLHPWCRCTFIIEVDDWDAWVEEYESRHGNGQAETVAGRLQEGKENVIIKAPKRKQFEPYDSSDKKASDKRALELIREETKYDEKTCKTIKKYLDLYFGDDYSEFVDGNKDKEVKIINDALSRMGAYDGDIFRGLKFGNAKSGQEFVDMLQPGAEIQMKSISSWSSEKWVANNFSKSGNESFYSVKFICKNNKTGVGVQHISEYGDDEAEVLVPSGTKWKVVDITENIKTRRTINGPVPATDIHGEVYKEVTVEVEEI